MIKLIKSYIAFFQPGCTGAEGMILSAALAAGGTIMQQQAADDAAKKQQRIISRAQEEEGRLSKQKSNEILNFAGDTYNPANRDQNYEQQATQNEQRLVDGLLSARPEGSDEVKKAAEGNLSADYLRSRGQATADATTDIMKRAKLLARANANSLLYGNEATKTGDLSSRIGTLESEQRINQGHTDTLLNSIRDKGSLAGGLLQGLAPAAGGTLNAVNTAKSNWEAAMRAMNGG